MSEDRRESNFDGRISYDNNCLQKGSIINDEEKFFYKVDEELNVYVNFDLIKNEAAKKNPHASALLYIYEIGRSAK